MTYKHDATPRGMSQAIEHAKAGSVVNPTFVWVDDSKEYVVASGLLPVDVLQRGGFLIYAHDVGRWVPRGSDDKMRDECPACFDLPAQENFTTL